MINSVLRPVFTFLLIIALQVLLFNNIQFGGYVNPYVYILIILILPLNFPSWLLLLLSFGTGLIIDVFSGSPGMHSSATLLAGFARPLVLRVISPRDGYDSGTVPSMATFGFTWFLTYTLTIVLIHHTALFYIEVFRLTDFFRTFLRMILGSAFSITFILLVEFYRRGK